jgi:glutamate racemase
MIGVFDSGFGGLTVHRALIEALPEKDFVYLGDNKNAPYGTRPPLEVLNLTCAGIERLFAEGCTLVIVACNTASVVTLRWIQQQWLPPLFKKTGIKRNAIGIVVPTIEAATGLGWNDEVKPMTPFAQEEQTPSLSLFPSAATVSPHTIAVFATARTVETDTYPYEIRKRRPDIHVVQQACPDLASAIEAGAPRKDMQSLIRKYVGQMQENLEAPPDSVILGCTHFPLVADIFAENLPRGVPIIHQPEATANALRGYLQRHPEYKVGSNGKRVFLSTGYSADALPLIEKFWGGKLDFKQA